MPVRPDFGAYRRLQRIDHTLLSRWCSIGSCYASGEEQHGQPLWHRHSRSSARSDEGAQFYVEHLGFEITDDNPNMIALHGKHLNLFIELGSPLGPVLRSDGWQRCRGEAAPGNGCEIVKDEPDFPRCYVKDPFGLIYNLTS